MNSSAILEQATMVTGRAWEYASGAGSVLDRARSLVAGDAQFFSVAPKVSDIRRSLDSDALLDKRDAMKRIIAQLCKGSDMRHFFPDVVKNIHAPSIELRKLIYLFVVYYADECPNEALLSISAFQRDLIDTSMHVRALALRMLCSLRIPAIHPVVLMAVKKCSNDIAPVVRKTAAIGLMQMHDVAKREMDSESVFALLASLLADRNADVVGAAVMAFSSLCPDRWALLHPVYCHLCKQVVVCDEWGQVGMLRVLLRYARAHFSDPTKAKQPSGSANSANSDDTASTSSDFSSVAPDFAPTVANNPEALDGDLLLLLNSAKLLLRSLNSAVVVGAIALLHHCGTSRFQDMCVQPAMRILRTDTDGQMVTLNFIYSLLLTHEESFRPYLKDFFWFPTDSADVRATKLRILVRLVTPATVADVFKELCFYVRHYDERAVVDAARGAGLLASQHADFSSYVARIITPLLTHSSPAVIAEAVNVLRILVLQGIDPARVGKLVRRLLLDVMSSKITEPTAVATVLWLVGENIQRNPSIAAAAPDCFRIFAQQFSTLETEVKREVLVLGAKVWVHLNGSSELATRFKLVYLFVMELARFDADYSIRDEERLLSATFERDGDAFVLFKTALLSEKPLPVVSDPYTEGTQYELGTFSHFFGHGVQGFEPLLPWATETTGTALRRPGSEQKSTALEDFDSSFSDSAGEDHEDQRSGSSSASFYSDDYSYSYSYSSDAGSSSDGDSAIHSSKIEDSSHHSKSSVETAQALPPGPLDQADDCVAPSALATELPVNTEVHESQHPDAAEPNTAEDDVRDSASSAC